MNHDVLKDEIAAVLKAWNGSSEVSASPILGGTLNWNFDVQTSGARYFLRCYRTNLPRERIVGEHQLLAWMAQRGIPAPAPIVGNDGETLVLHGNQRWAIFPWSGGATVPRGTLSSAQARALGDVHGRIQAVLATHPESREARMTQRWDKNQSLELLAKVSAAAEKEGVEEWVAVGIARQRQMLQALDVLPPEHFSSLPCQLLHGDFHDQQVLFDNDSVTAVVDWEIWHTDPRSWELVRSLAYSQLLESPQLEDYLAGYREHVRLSEEECRLALQLWFQSRVVGLWAWWAYFFEGNTRVKSFFPAMIAELDRMSDERWKTSTASRLVRAACA